MRLRFRCWTSGLLLVTCAFTNAAADDSSRGTTVAFTGYIDADTVAAFIARHRTKTIERIVVESEGGDVREALVLANWIVDRGLDVEVRKMCASSCANYLFAAGRRKIIDDGGLVIWHGSILQKNFRARGDDCNRRIRELEHVGGELADRSIEALDFEQRFCAFHASTVAQQAAFFARVSVDEYITRMGQETYAYKTIWTVPAAVVKRMRLRDAETPAGYASHEYLKRWNRAGDLEPILSLGFDDAGRVIEVAR